MKDAELDQLLKSAPVPDRPEAYWNEFFRGVMAKAHWLQTQTQTETNRARSGPLGLRSRLRFATVVLGLAAIGFVLGFALHFRQARHEPITDSQLAAARKCFQEIETLFPNQVQAIVFDQQGPHLALAQQANVPVSPPLYLRICGNQGCRNYVTFSGQEILVGGQKMTVLADARGGIILTGDQFVWSTTEQTHAGSQLKIEARNLGLTAM